MLYHYAVQCYFSGWMWQEPYVFWSLCSGGCWVSFVCQSDGNLKWHWNSSSLSDALIAPGSPGDPCTPDMKHVFCRRGIPIRENALDITSRSRDALLRPGWKTLAVGFKPYISCETLSVHNAPFLLFSLYTTVRKFGIRMFFKKKLHSGMMH